MDAKAGNELWKQLHEFAETRRYAGLFFEKWMLEVKANIGCETCFKKLHWFLKKWPVDYGNGFQLWAWSLHDFVNKELGRPLYYPEKTLEPLMQRGIIQ